MLVLSRKVNQKIVLGDDIEVMIVEIRGDKVRLGITAPREVPVHRQEVVEKIKAKEAEQKDYVNDLLVDLP
jgi:carbon storage regulator